MWPRSRVPSIFRIQEVEKHSVLEVRNDLFFLRAISKAYGAPELEILVESARDEVLPDYACVPRGSFLRQPSKHAVNGIAFRIDHR